MESSFIYRNYYAPFHDLVWWQIGLDKDTEPPEIESEQKFYLPYNKWFSKGETVHVEAITLLPGEEPRLSKRSYKRFADLSSFTNLKYLSVPYEALAHMDLASISPHLLHFHITTQSTGDVIDFSDPKARYQIPEWVMPKLKTLSLFVSPNKCSNFNPGLYPGLEWMDTDVSMDKSGAGIKYFSQNKSLKGIGLDSINSKKALQYLRNNLMALRFWSITSRLVNLDILEEFQNLRYLEIRNSLSKINCNILSSLPNLEELELIYNNELSNIADLLKSDSLKRVRIVSRTTDIRQDLKAQFIEKFNYLEF